MSIASIQAKYPSAIWYDSNHGGTNSGTLDNPYTSMSTAIGAITSNDNVIAVLDGTHSVSQIGGSSSVSNLTLGGTADKLSFVGESTNAVISTTGYAYGSAINLRGKSYDLHLESIKFYQNSTQQQLSMFETGSGTTITVEDCVIEMGSNSLSAGENRGMFGGNPNKNAVIVIRRSLIFTTATGNNTFFGSVLGQQQQGFASATIENCTIKTQGSNQLISSYHGSGGPNPLNFKNNIVVGSGNQYLTYNNTYGPSSGITHNCYYNTATTLANARDVAGAIVDDPQFIDSTTGDYRLRPSSPCIGAGTAS